MNAYNENLLTSLVHPTDFSEASNLAFEHALAISVKAKSSLSILHINRKDSKRSDWSYFPHIRTTLKKWGLLDKEIPKEQVFSEVGIRIQKVEIKSSNAVRSIVKFTERHPTDLIVLATHDKNSLPGWIRGSVSGPVARECRKKTIFIPEISDGFILDSGRVNLENILIPVDINPNPLSAIKYTVNLARFLSDSEKVNILLFHVGGSIKLGEIEMYSDEKVKVSKEVQSGKIIDEILKRAEIQGSDLIVMPTHGHDGILDVLRGSTTERVLHNASCPVLAYPAYY